MFACTWVSIHPNIPGLDEGRPTKFLRRLGITIVALLAPELVVIWALRQWLVSRRLAKEYADLGWKQVHGFFAIMGGFMLYDKNTPQNVILTHELSSFRERFELRVTAQEIWDRSKGDLLSKGLVVLQTSWFIFQCIVRAHHGLAITQLETVTLAFAAINFVIYGLWWNKPLGVECPVPVCREYEKEGGRLGDDGAFCLSGILAAITNSFTGFSRYFKEISTWRMVNRYLGFELIERVVRGRDDNRVYAQHGVHHPMFRGDINSCFSYISEPSNSSPTARTCPNLPAIDLPTTPPLSRASTASPNPVLPLYNAEPKISAPVPVQIKFTKVPTFYSGWHSGQSRGSLSFFERFINSPALFGVPIATVFGAIHCIAWSSLFPTNTEQRLWHAASIILIVAPLFPLNLVGFFRFIDWYHTSSSTAKRLKSRTTAVVNESIFLLSSFNRVVTLLYILARLFIMVEAFASLRTLPDSAYRTVELISFLPHI
ncbi:hypothetical protein VKT23_016960 [Stygiomarasmius scandens]|uniref:Uncharacterized protein n=1 Tax=Marasmiellus scandens TaxID=2682957 RepID=A0ABR1ITE7_9AGAR